jgi:hypothetical protein
MDATIALSWCFSQDGAGGTEDSGYAQRVLEALREQEAVVTPTWPTEVAEGLLVAERRGRVRADEVARIARLLLALPITVDPVDRARAGTTVFRLARTRALSSYDAGVLELAIRLALPIATLGRDLRIAAGTEGVPLFRPGKAG